MKKKDLKGKKVFITGISGFVGKHLAEKLMQLGADVYGISRLKKGKNILNSTILDYTCIENFVRKHKIRVCIHLASEALVESGQINPYTTFKTNTEGTLNILEITRKLHLEKLIIASTSHVYGKNRVPYYEGYTPRPTRPYETSKACTDLIAQSYANTFNLPILIPRFMNIYGPADLNFERLIPKTIKNIFQNISPEIWGGNVVRDYLYIDDAVEAYVCLLKANPHKIKRNKIFNFGGGNLISVSDLVDKIIRLSGKKITVKKIADRRPQEIITQYVSWNKARTLLGWQPSITLDTGLLMTIKWYNENI